MIFKYGKRFRYTPSFNKYYFFIGRFTIFQNGLLINLPIGLVKFGFGFIACLGTLRVAIRNAPS